MEEKEVYTIKLIDGSEYDCTAYGELSDILNQYKNYNTLIVSTELYPVMVLPKSSILFIAQITY